jgi:hypothetical protein
MSDRKTAISINPRSIDQWAATRQNVAVEHVPLRSGRGPTNKGKSKWRAIFEDINANLQMPDDENGISPNALVYGPMTEEEMIAAQSNILTYPRRLAAALGTPLSWRLGTRSEQRREGYFIYVYRTAAQLN